MTVLWVSATVAAAAFQVGRNALQRGLMPRSGPWGATLVRFLFGLPFALAFTGVAVALSQDLDPHFGWAFWWPALAGAASQVAATAALLMAMHRAGFAVGTALQLSSVPLAAILGLAVFGDRLSALGWAGVALTTCGLAALAWPRHAGEGADPAAGVAFGIVSGLCFGFALNAFRHAGLALEPRHPFFAATMSLTLVQAFQAAALTLYLALCDRRALAAVFAGWRPSLGAGLCGACASAGWFLALNLASAAAVRSLGVIEMPLAALAGHRLFAERVTPAMALGALAVAAGVAMTAGL